MRENVAVHNILMAKRMQGVSASESARNRRYAKYIVTVKTGRPTPLGDPHQPPYREEFACIRLFVRSERFDKLVAR
jgi:hypothetical protein